MLSESLQKNTLIFDLDGTLLNTLDDLADSTNYALQQHNLPARTLNEVRQFVGNGVGKLIRRAVPDNTPDDATAAVFQSFKAHYAQHCMDKTQMYPGVREMLACFHATGYKLAIVSNKLQSAVDELHERFFKQWVQVAVGEREGLQRKPAPDMVTEALKALHASPAEAVYVGDSEVDLATARNAALPCISVLWGFREQEFLKAHGAERFAKTPADVVTLIISDKTQPRL